MFQCHYLRRASQCAFAALDAVGMQITYFLASRVVGCELHWADAGTTLTFHLAGTLYVNVGERLREWSLLRSYPVRDGSHGAERTPGTWRIDEI